MLQGVSESAIQVVTSVHINGVPIISSYTLKQDFFLRLFVVLKALLIPTVGFLACHSFIRAPLAIVENIKPREKG
jgi:hypothetical protein